MSAGQCRDRYHRLPADFRGLTGQAPATVAAIGAIMLPAMLKNGYSKSETGSILAFVAGLPGPFWRYSAQYLYDCIRQHDERFDSEMFVAAIANLSLQSSILVAVNYDEQEQSGVAVVQPKEVAGILSRRCRYCFFRLLSRAALLGSYAHREAVTCVIYSLVLLELHTGR